MENLRARRDLRGARGRRRLQSYDVAPRDASARLVAQCTNLGSLDVGAVDRASFELLDPARGRGVIFRYGSRTDFDQARALILSGGEAWTAAERSRVRDVLGAL